MNTRTPMVRTARAFTLVELTMALLVTTILLGAVGSLVVMTTRAAAGSPQTSAATDGTADAVNRLAQELGCAITVREATATSVEFTVADRNADASPETIRYSWGGAGQALMREYNGSAKVAVTSALATFDLGYTTTSKTTSQTVTVNSDSGEVLLAGANGWTGITPTLRELGVTTASWGSQFFRIDRVALPAGLTNLSITRVRLQMRRGSSGNVTVAIHQPGTSPQPSTTLIGSAVSIPSGSLPATQGWVDIPLSAVNMATAQTDFNIVVKGTASTAGYMRYLDATAAPTDAPVYLWTTNSGGAWNPSSSRNRYDAPFEVYGSYQSSSQSTQNVTTYSLKSARITIRPGSSPAPATTNVRTLNAPIVPAGAPAA